MTGQTVQSIDHPNGDAPKLSDQLEGWVAGEGEKTLGGLIDVFEEKSFAILFVLLLGVPALPLPTGGATHVFEVIAVLLASQLVAGRGCALSSTTAPATPCSGRSWRSARWPPSSRRRSPVSTRCRRSASCCCRSRCCSRTWSSRWPASPSVAPA